MPFYTKYKDTTYEADLNSASTTYSPADSTNGRPCSTTQSDTGTRVASQYSANSSMIYTQVASKFTQTITLSNGSYVKSWSVSRGTSPEESATTGVIASGTTSGGSVTVYLNDTLTSSATAADTSYSDWNFTSLSAPTVTTRTHTSVTVKNNNAYPCTLYWGTSIGATTYSKPIGASATIDVTSNINAGTIYFFTVKSRQSRTKYTYSVSKSWSSRTVDGANTLTITGSRTSTTEDGSTIASSSTTFTTPYLITLNKNDNVSSISLTYYDNSNTQQTVTSAGSYYGKWSTAYSWTATPATGYNISSGSGSGTLTGNITISPTASLKTFTITVNLSGSYISFYRGVMTATNSTHSDYGWTAGADGSTTQWTFTAYYGDAISFTSTSSTSGSATYSCTNPSSITVTAATSVTYICNTKTCLTCSAVGTCSSSSSCTSCSAVSTCGKSSSGCTSCSAVSTCGSSTRGGTCIIATCRRTSGQ